MHCPYLALLHSNACIFDSFLVVPTNACKMLAGGRAAVIASLFIRQFFQRMESNMSVPSVTPGGTCLDRNEAGCIAEIQAFLKGGSDGAKRLKEVVSSLFVYFKIVTSNEKANVLL